MSRPPFIALVCLVLAAAAPLRADDRADVSAALNAGSLQPGQQAVLAVVLDIKDGFHAQSHTPLDPDAIKTTVTLDASSGATSYAPIYPAAHDLTTPALGRLSVYSGRTIIYIPLQISAGAAGALKVTGHLTYQICNDTTCFAPTTVAFSAQAPISTAVYPAPRPELFAAFDPKVFSHLLPPAAAAPKAGFYVFGVAVDPSSPLLVLCVALLVGVIFNAMPCVLPVLPLKALGFYEAAHHSRARSFAFGLVFSIGIVCTFGILALLILVGGKSWGQQFSNGWFLTIVVAILTVMALGMFGLFTFHLPTGVYRFDPAHDTFVGNFFFGIFTAVLSTPCTAPLLQGLLAVAALQPRAAGVATIMTVGVGMALPYLLLSALPELARRLPRSGPWSELIKQMMGFLLLAVAAYLAGQRLLPAGGALWAVFVIISAAAVFLVVRTAQLMPRPKPLIISAVLATLLTGGSLGAAVALAPSTPWPSFSSQALDEARAAGRIVLVDFTAGWCGNCQYVDATVFGNRRVQAALERHHVLLLKADLTTDDAPGWPKLKQLSSTGGIPLTVIYAPGLAEPIELSSVYTPQELIDALDRAAAR